MGVFRADGGRNTTSGANYSPSPSSNAGPVVHRPRTFNEAVANAQATSDKALKSKKPEDYALADASWQIVQDWEEDEYRKAAQSSDPKTATVELDHKYEVILRGDSIQAKIFKQITADAKKTVETESPSERQFQIKLYGEQAKVDEAYDKLQNAPADKKSEAFTKYMTSVKNVINLQVDHELSKLPAGPDGSHTLAQWKEAAGKVKELNKADPQTALIIDKMAEVRGYLDVLKHDPDSLKLTPAEKELAQKDPVTLAFVKAAGITLDPNDPKLSPEMQQIAKDDPVLFTLLQLSKIEITTSATPVAADSPVGQLGNGQYIHVKVNGKEITEAGLLDEVVKVYDGTEQKDRAVSVGGEVFSKLNIKSDNLDALMIAADNGRTQYATEHMKTLMSGSNPDLKAAVSFLNTQLNGFFDRGTRAAFWESAGKPYITEDRFRQKFLDLIKKPDPTSTDIEDIRALNSTEVNADRVGKYIQDLLKDAPREVADVILDTVKSTFNKDFYKSNQYDSMNSTPRFHDFYKALSMAVELSPGRALEMAQWLMDRDAVQGGVLYQLWDASNRRFEGVKDTVEDGFGIELSRTLQQEVQKNREFQNMEYDLNMRVGQGWEKIQEKYSKKINKQNYKDFMDNPDKFLEPFFQSFLKDQNIGRPVEITSDVQLRNIVGKILGITPTNTKAATELDYSKDWFAGSPEWETIILGTQMISERGGDRPTITALPLKYVSELGGVSTGALILVGDSGSDQDVIDLTAARNATLMSGGSKVKLGDVKDQWHFGDLKSFQEDNHYDDDGYIFLPKDLRLMDGDGDGKIEAQDWERIDAAITTGGEYAQTIGLTALAVTGTVLLFIPGANVVGAGILLGTAALGGASSGLQIFKMWRNGADISWSNEQAQFHYLNMAGTLLTFGRLGILTKFAGSTAKLAPYMRGAGNVMGLGGTVIGFSQMAQQGQLLVEHWDSMNWIDRTTSLAALGSGATTMILSGVQPGKNMFKNPVADSGAVRVATPRQTGLKASEIWDQNGSPKNGLVAALWGRAKTQFDKRIAAAWDKQAGEKWWTDAIEAKAQNLAGKGNAVTDVHRNNAKANHKDEIAQDAFKRWRDDHNSPKEGPSGILWTKAQKRYDKEVGWGAWRLWSAEHRFMKDIGAPAYNAFKAWQAAHKGATPEPWWKEALAPFRPKIDARAKQLKQDDIAGGKTLSTDSEYMNKAEAEFGPAIGVEAYRLWNGTHRRRAPTVTLIGGGKKLPAAFTYKGWQKAGEPERVTTKIDDTVYYASTEKVFGRTRNQLKQAATDYTVWTGAEKAFKTRIGNDRFAEWEGSTINRALGKEDTFFEQANSFYKTQIADEAYTIFRDPGSRKLPPFLQKRMTKGVTVEFWQKNKADFDAILTTVAKDWVKAKRPRLAYWKDAVNDLDPHIKAHETTLQAQATAGGQKLTKTLQQQIRKKAEERFAFDIAKRVFERWSANPKTTVKYAGDWQNAKTTRENSYTEPAYQKWAEAGSPSGWHNVPWVLARRSVLKPGSFKEGVQQYGERFGGWMKDLGLQSAIRAKQRGGTFNSIGFRQHLAQTLGSMKTTLKWYGIAYGTVNGLGIAGWALTNHALAEERTAKTKIDGVNAEPELQKLLQDSDYVDENYRNKLGFVPLGDTWFQADGHLMAFVDPQTKEVVYFRRIPKDMYDELEEKAGTRKGDPNLYKPWVGTDLDNQLAGVQVFTHDGQIYVYEPMKLSDDGGVPLDEIDLLKGGDPTGLPIELKEQAGVRAYLAWMDAGRPNGTAAATLWEQAETRFLADVGKPTYDAWVKAQRPMGGANSYWQDAVAPYRQQIDAEATKLWEGDGKPGSGPSQQHKTEAEAKFGGQIVLDAYRRWNKNRPAGTFGADSWKAYEPTLQSKVGAPAFDVWANAKRPVDGANIHWKTAADDWEADGMPVLQQVALRAPYRVEGNVDWSNPSSHETGPYGIGGSMGRRDRFIAAAGPIEGWRMHANLELLANYRYNAPTATTVRVGGPSPTQGWGWDVRQQDTTFWSRINISFGSIEYNGAQVYDVTDESHNGWSVMNTRAYLDLGNRNRAQFDMTGKFFRARETGFAELGLGSDFVKVTLGDKTINLNGYYELQAYAPDFRAQLNWKNGPITNVRGIEQFPPALGIDPALQLTLSYNPWKVPLELPYFSVPVR